MTIGTVDHREHVDEPTVERDEVGVTDVRREGELREPSREVRLRVGVPGSVGASIAVPDECVDVAPDVVSEFLG